MRLADYDFVLPPDCIAQTPADPRDSSRLLHLPRDASQPPAHHIFRELSDLLRPGDLLVLNDTRVIPARLFGRRAKSGGKVEVLLVRERDPLAGRWEALLGAGGRLVPGEVIEGIGDRLSATLEKKGEDGTWTLTLSPVADVWPAIEAAGRLPLPGYIARDGKDAKLDELDRERYQTVFARERGAIAAPTAGLHFTDVVFQALERRGVARAFVTLHVGPGTFRPVKTEDPRDHPMHAEAYVVPRETIAAIEETRARKGRVIAVGTTSARTLESFARTGLAAADTRIYIYPPFDWRLVDGLLTNFHLPKSTLLLLVAALAGRERLLAAYADAIARGYRFFSYGDAMLVL